MDAPAGPGTIDVRFRSRNDISFFRTVTESQREQRQHHNRWLVARSGRMVRSARGTVVTQLLDEVPRAGGPIGKRATAIAVARPPDRERQGRWCARSRAPSLGLGSAYPQMPGCSTE